MNASRNHAKTGLVLTGGGARAAYQVGVLKAVARIRREVGAPRHNPFGVIAGTSAGAINAAAIACHADRFDLSVAGLVHVWRHFSADQVYRADAFGVVRTGARWLTMLTLGWAIARWRRARPRSLLDNEPLGELLQRVVPLDRVPEMLRSGHLSALAITASSYSSGDHVTFCQTARPFQPWLRSQRVAVPCAISWRHLMASSAIPFVFPAVQLERGRHDEWFGDGSMRQSGPNASSWSAQAACTSRRAVTSSPTITRAWRRSPATRCRTSFSTRSRSMSSVRSASTAPWPCSTRERAHRRRSNRWTCW